MEHVIWTVYFLSLTLSTQVVGKIVPFTICSLNKNKCGSESVIVLVLTSSSSLVVLVVVVAVMGTNYFFE